MITMQLTWFPRKGLCMGLERELRLSTEYIFLCEWKTVYLTWMISLLMQLILGLSSFFLNNKRMLGPYLVSRSFIISAFSHPSQIQIWSKWLSLNVFDSHILTFHYYQKIYNKKKTLIFTYNVMTFAFAHEAANTHKLKMKQTCGGISSAKDAHAGFLKRKINIDHCPSTRQDIRASSQ